MALHAIGSGGLRPDLTLLLEVDEARVAHRLEARDGDESDAIGGRDLAYHRRVASAFRKYAKDDPDGFAVIDGCGTPDEVHNGIMQAVAPLLEAA